MSDASVAKFKCEVCGKRFAWKPELAGRRAKCKCGNVIMVPSKPPQPVAAGPPQPAGSQPAAGDPEWNPLDDPTYGMADDGEGAAPARPAKAVVAAAATGARCSSCGQSVAAGAVLCVNCGFNLKTGKKLNTTMGDPDLDAAPAAAAAPPRKAPAANSGGAAPAMVDGVPMPRNRRGAEPEPSRGGMLKILVPIALVLVVVGAVVGFKTLSKSGTNTPTGPALGEDAEIYAMLKDPGMADLVEWIDAHPNYVVNAMTREKAKGFAENQQRRGAVKVLVPKGMFTLWIAIELPQDPALRKQLFAYEQSFHNTPDEMATKDVGQKYLKFIPSDF